MASRRKSKPAADQAVATIEAPAPDQPSAPAIVHAASDGSHLPAERVAAHENGHAPHREPAQSHAAAVGKRPEIVQSGITFSANDLLAGARMGEGFRLIGGRKIREGIIKFEEKPSPAVIQAMHDAHFTWLPDGKVWAHQIRPESAWQDRAHTEKTFETVTAAIRQERGITHSYGSPG